MRKGRIGEQDGIGTFLDIILSDIGFTILLCLVAADWVLAQTLDRKRRELEAEEIEYSERLAKARQREAVMRKAARGRVRKKMVITYTSTKCLAQ